LAGIDICPGLRTSTLKVSIGLSLSLLVDLLILPVDMPNAPPLLLLVTLGLEVVLSKICNKWINIYYNYIKITQFYLSNGF